MSRSIKMEEEDYPLSSDHALFNHCLTTFYDQDSDDIIQAKCSAQDVFEILEHSIDLCDTPLADIMRLVEENAAFRGVDAELVKKKVLKRKYLLKRLRAKDRRSGRERKLVVVELPLHCDPEEEFKKQRNRMSAQISRDKKKQKVKALEELNQQLLDQCERQRMENERLRAEIENSNQRTTTEGPLKSKLTRLLILLGIIFLFGLIKETFAPQNSSAVPLAKMSQLAATNCPVKTEAFPDTPLEDNARVMAAIEQSLVEVVEPKGLAVRWKQRVMKELKTWGGIPWGLNARAREEILMLKEEVLRDQ